VKEVSAWFLLVHFTIRSPVLNSNKQSVRHFSLPLFILIKTQGFLLSSNHLIGCGVLFRVSFVQLQMKEM